MNMDKTKNRHEFHELARIDLVSFEFVSIREIRVKSLSPIRVYLRPSVVKTFLA